MLLRTDLRLPRPLPMLPAMLLRMCPPQPLPKPPLTLLRPPPRLPPTAPPSQPPPLRTLPPTRLGWPMWLHPPARRLPTPTTPPQLVCFYACSPNTPHLLNILWLVVQDVDQCNFLVPLLCASHGGELSAQHRTHVPRSMLTGEISNAAVEPTRDSRPRRCCKRPRHANTGKRSKPRAVVHLIGADDGGGTLAPGDTVIVAECQHS